MSSTTLLATLRAATAEHHARTESLVPVLDPALGLHEYAAILWRFRAAYELLEARLARVAEWPRGFDVAARRWTPLLGRDLAWLEERGALDHASLDVAVVPSTGDVPTMAEALGILYVLEGAALGGQVIVRRVGPRLGVTASGGASFFTGAGAATGTRWREFGAMADRWGSEHREAWDEVVRAARATFEVIAAQFSKS